MPLAGRTRGDTMRRRDILASAGAIVGSSVAFPAPAVSQGLRQFTMVTDWPEGPGLLPSARRAAAAGAVVRPLETLDAVQAGLVEMFVSNAGYFEKKAPALHFYSGVPFGFTDDERSAWMQFGICLELFCVL